MNFESFEQEVLWTAYALGECSESDAKRLEEELKQSPEKRQWVQELQALAGRLESELSTEPTLSLTELQHVELQSTLDALSQTHTLDETSTVNESQEPCIAEPQVDTAEPQDTRRTLSWKWIVGSMSSLCAMLLILWSVQSPQFGPPVQMKTFPSRFARALPQQDASKSGKKSVHKAASSHESSLVPKNQRVISKPQSHFSTDKKNRPVPVDVLGQHAQFRVNRNRVATQLDEVKKRESKGKNEGKRVRRLTEKGQVNSGEHDQVAVKRKKKKSKKSTQKKADLRQVWQRSKKNTRLSNVSVGGGKFLILKKMRVTVQVDGLRARTIIDHIYYNPYARALQGTFKYTLPTRSSVSYYGMFIGQQPTRRPRFFSRKGTGLQLRKSAPQKMVRSVSRRSWGKLREARLVPAEKARQVYENITRRRIDPALLEQDAPNTFTGRVFPIPARGYNRVIFAYEQTLPQLAEQLVYRFRFPEQVAESIDFILESNGRNGAVQRTNLRSLRCASPVSKTYYRCMWEKNKPDRDAIFYFRPQRRDLSWVTGTDPVEKKRYLYMRSRVQLPQATRSYSAKQAVFMLDTSLSENPDLFAAHVRILRAVLKQNASTLKRFNILFFDVSASWLRPSGWIPNTAKERKLLLQKLEQIVLEGATHFDAALKKLARPTWSVQPKSALDVFVLSDGQSNWGNTRLRSRLHSFHKKHPYGAVRFFAYHTGIGSENQAFGLELTRRGGAVFSCLGASEIPRCARAHTRPAMQIQSVTLQGIGARELLIEGRQAQVYPGAWLTLASRYLRDGRATLVVKGTYLGKQITWSKTLNVRTEGELAPRAWAELTVSHLLALRKPSLKPLIVAYAQHFQIPNVHCSMLVLETDKEYKQYGLERLRKEKRVGDIARFLERQYVRLGTQRTQRSIWRELLLKSLKTDSKMSQRMRIQLKRILLSMLRFVPEKHFQFHVADSQTLWTKDAILSKSYLKKRLHTANRYDAFVDEARLRLKRDVGGAIRALSSIVELKPSDPRALRLVAYYLMGWKRPEEAAYLFLRVLQRRSFEPHAYRDVARTLVQMRRYLLAATLYEIVLKRTWHARFRNIRTLLREEYALLIQEALRTLPAGSRHRSILRRRKSYLGLYVRRSKLRVTVTWNTDNTDVDLWVYEPDGSTCSYRKRKTRNGGHLLQDMTRGYGPERYAVYGGRAGTYRIQLRYFGHSSTVFGNETHVWVRIVKNAGTPQQKVIEKNSILKRVKSKVNVAKIVLR